MKKRILSLLLALVLTVGVLPFAAGHAQAAGSSQQGGQVSDLKHRVGGALHGKAPGWPEGAGREGHLL